MTGRNLANRSMLSAKDPDPTDPARSARVRHIAETVMNQPSVSIGEAANLLGLSADQVRDLIKYGHLPNAYQETPRKTARYRIPQGDLAAYKARVAGFTAEGAFYYDQPVMTIPEAAARLGLTAKQVRGLISIVPGHTRSSLSSAFPNAFKRVPKGKHPILIPESDVMAYMVRQAPLRSDVATSPPNFS